jgi:uncharacterized membrane protein YeaQ/YmgE (transglycosylase-associated protein family)
MGLLIAIAVGAVLGWIAAILNRTDRRHGVLPWALVGVLGALLGAFVFGPVFGGGNLLEAALDLRTLYVTAAGSAGLLGLIIWWRRRRRRKRLQRLSDPLADYSSS